MLIYIQLRKTREREVTKMYIVVNTKNGKLIGMYDTLRTAQIKAFDIAFDICEGKKYIKIYKTEVENIPFDFHNPYLTKER